MFFSLYAGDADTVIVRWSTPAAVASSAPLTLGTSAHSVTSGDRSAHASPATTSAAPAIAGTAFGLTNDGDLDVAEAGADQPRDQLHPLLGLHRLFALQPVAGQTSRIFTRSTDG